MAEQPRLVRFKHWCGATHRHEMLEDPNGAWVLYYAAQAEIARLTKRIEELERQRTTDPSKWTAWPAPPSVSTAATDDPEPRDVL